MNKLFKLSFLVIPLVPAMIFAAHEGRLTATDKFKAKKDLLRLQNLVENRCYSNHAINIWQKSPTISKAEKSPIEKKNKQLLVKTIENIRTEQINEIEKLTVQYDCSDGILQKAVDSAIKVTNDHPNYQPDTTTNPQNQIFEADEEANAILSLVFWKCWKAKQSLIKQEESNILPAEPDTSSIEQEKTNIFLAIFNQVFDALDCN